MTERCVQVTGLASDFRGRSSSEKWYARFHHEGKPDSGLDVMLKEQRVVHPRRIFCFSGATLHRWVPFLVLALLAMTSTRPADGTGAEGTSTELPPCPASPNCVSSDAPEGPHHVAPFLIEGNPEAAWSTALKIVGEWLRTTAVLGEPTVARFECRSALFRFVDDVELQLRPDQDLIAVRSASRVGYSDFGVNRKRVEELRAALQTAGVVR